MSWVLLYANIFGMKHPGTTPHWTKKGALREDTKLETDTAWQWPNDGPVDGPSMDSIFLKVEDSLNQPKKPPSTGRGLTNGPSMIMLMGDCFLPAFCNVRGEFGISPQVF